MPLQALLVKPAWDRIDEAAEAGNERAIELQSYYIGQVVGSFAQLRPTAEITRELVETCRGSTRRGLGRARGQLMAFLDPYRVVDFTDERGLLAGRMLADLGADVVQVEPPDGSTRAPRRSVLARRRVAVLGCVRREQARRDLRRRRRRRDGSWRCGCARTPTSSSSPRLRASWRGAASRTTTFGA